MARDEFLKIWQPYAVSPKACRDVATVAVGEWLGGRLGRRKGGPQNGLNAEWSLSSAGATVGLRFLNKSKWFGQASAGEDFDEAVVREGDILAVKVVARRTETSDPVVEVSQVQLLVPSLEPFTLASKFDPARGALWTEFAARVRTFFASRGFTEALTPTLVPSPGTEPFLDAFATEWEIGSSRTKFYLPTSPEFHLKKLLVAGWTRVFEIRNCFRNGEIGAHHQPEFSMLEWYRAYSDLDAIAEDAAALLSSLGAGELKRTTMAKLFAESFSGFTLTPKTTREELAALAEKSATRIEPTDTWDEIFFRLFLEHIEEGLGADQPLLVRGYPPSQAALSRIGADGFADRFEIYWRGMELANAFHELNDPHENAARFEQDAKAKLQLGKPAVPIDQDLMRALRHGLPPSGGIALGMDRLFMALHGISDIADARAFPVSRLYLAER